MAFAWCAAWGLALPSARAQDERDANAVLPSDLRSQLTEIADFAPNFDHPAYYALLGWVKQQDALPAAALELDDWTVLAERPSEFRGRVVAIDGYVGRNKPPYTHVNHPELGQVWQLELYQANEPIKATVICTTNVGDVPVRSRIRVAGVFVMMRQYRDARNRDQYAALLVAQGPTLIERAVPQPRDGGFSWGWVLAAAVLGLGLAWFWLRSATRSSGRRSMRTLQASRTAPMSVADDAAEWAEHDQPDQR